MVGTTGAPLLGRQAELAQLVAAFAEARSGVATVVALGGDAGMGKTRLVAEFRARVEFEAAHVLVGGAVDMRGGGLPLAPVAGAIRSLLRSEPASDRWRQLIPEALHPLVPELDRGGTGPTIPANRESGQVVLLGSILRLLTDVSRSGPVVLVLEDMHWADEATRDLLPFLSRHLGDAPVLVVVTYRTDEMHRQHPLRPLLAELARLPSSVAIELAPLDPAAVGELARSVAQGPLSPDVVQDISRRSRGNPFVVEELVAAHLQGHSGIPASVADLLLLRLEAVRPQTLDVLRLVAMVGRPTSDALLDQLAPEDVAVDAAVREAVERSLLVVDDGAYAFRHALLAEAIDATLLPGEQRRLHRRVAETLERHPELASQSTPLSELAHHWYLAGEHEAAMAAAARAADEAEATAAYGEAARLVERIVEHWTDVDDPEAVSGASRRDSLARAAQLRYLASVSRDAIRLCRGALELTGEDAEPVVAGLLYERLGRYLWVTDAPLTDVLAAYARAVDLVPHLPATPERARVLAAHGQALMLAQRYPESVTRCREAIEVARHCDAPLWEAHARNSLGMSLCWLGLTDEGLAELAAAREGAAAIDDADETSRALGNSLEALWLAGRPDEALDLTEQAIAFAERVGIDTIYAPMMAAGGVLAAEQSGQWDRAFQLIARYRWTGHAYGTRWMSLSAARIAMARGDVAAAEEHLRLADRVRASEDVQTALFSQVAGVAFAVAAGDATVACRRASEVLEGFDGRSEPPLHRLIALADLAVALADLGPTPERDELLRGARAAADDAAAALPQGDETPPAVRSSLARIAAVDPDALPGPDRWRPVVEVAVSQGLVPVEAVARLRLAEALLADDAREEAEGHLRRAAELARRLDARPLLERVEVTAKRGRLTLGGAGSSDDAPRPADLTPREFEVLTLVADGMTNPEIGRELFISEKTASVHVSRILRKLEVSNRTEAAVVAQRLGVGRPAAPA